MTTVLDVFGPTSDDCSASANNICQFTPLISVSPNSNEDQLCSKHDLFLVESVHDESFQRSSPSSFKTPSKEVSSPGSLELPSMPSDKSSSRDCSDGHSSVNFLFSSDLTDTDRSNSVCSLSPSTQPTEHFSNANDEFFLLCPDRMLESAFVRSVGADMDDNRAVSNKIPDGITDIQTPLNTPLQNSCSNDGNYSAFTSLAYNESETTQYKYHDAPSRPDCPQPIGTNTYPTIMTASYVLPSKVGVKVDSCVSKVGGIFTVCDQSTTFPESSTCLLKSPDSSATFNSRHLSDFCQSSENTPDCIRSRGNSVLVPDSFARRRGESKLLYDQNDTDFQTSKPTCSPKTVDPHTTRFDPINIKNKYISNDFSHQRVPVITGPERTTTFASGKRSRNAYSSPCILPLKGRNCHAESKLLSNYGHMYKTTVVSVTSYPPYSLDQNMAPSRDSITLTKRKTFINNWDSRHNWRNNDINPVTKIDYSSVPGFQDSSASKSKRKGSRVVGRGGKRHKSLDSEIHSCRTNQTPSNVSLHSLLLQDVSRFIQDPVLRPLLHLYAPTPLPPCSQPNFSTSISDLASLGQKYFRFPMSLRKLKDKPIAEEIF
ncbi:unnamed protein product [Heterobilharzia americana]|nr:unnamed protein product [Heterobilharzia americana]